MVCLGSPSPPAAPTTSSVESQGTAMQARSFSWTQCRDEVKPSLSPLYLLLSRHHHLLRYLRYLLLLSLQVDLPCHRLHHVHLLLHLPFCRSSFPPSASFFLLVSSLFKLCFLFQFLLSRSLLSLLSPSPLSLISTFMEHYISVSFLFLLIFVTILGLFLQPGVCFRTSSCRLCSPLKLSARRKLLHWESFVIGIGFAHRHHHLLLLLLSILHRF